VIVETPYGEMDLVGCYAFSKESEQGLCIQTFLYCAKRRNNPIKRRRV
jgi:hypothetical protein